MTNIHQVTHTDRQMDDKATNTVSRQASLWCIVHKFTSTPPHHSIIHAPHTESSSSISPLMGAPALLDVRSVYSCLYGLSVAALMRLDCGNDTTQ